MSLAISKPAIDLGIITRDAEPMLAFYRDLLGLDVEGVIPMPSGGTMHRLKVGDSVVKIVQLERAPPADAATGGIPGATGYRYWTVHISNLAAVVQLCEQAGHKVVVPPKVIRPGITIAMVVDPDGNWVELLQAD
jgi:catechol 2,3-dioxygenase-like lactoylglutathione lyase family enzyme